MNLTKEELEANRDKALKLGLIPMAETARQMTVKAQVRDQSWKDRTYIMWQPSIDEFFRVFARGVCAAAEKGKYFAHVNHTKGNIRALLDHNTDAIEYAIMKIEEAGYAHNWADDADQQFIVSWGKKQPVSPNAADEGGRETEKGTGP